MLWEKGMRGGNGAGIAVRAHDKGLLTVSTPSGGATAPHFLREVRSADIAATDTRVFLHFVGRQAPQYRNEKLTR